MISMETMKTLEARDGKIEIPNEFQLSHTKRKLHIKTPWAVKTERLCKDNFTVQTQVWCRHEKLGDKPYIPEGFIEIDGERIKVIDMANPANHPSQTKIKGDEE